MTDPNEEKNQRVINGICGVFEANKTSPAEAIEILFSLTKIIFKKLTVTLEPIQKTQILERYIKFIKEWE